jgi:hypothetical protein
MFVIIHCSWLAKITEGLEVVLFLSVLAQPSLPTNVGLDHLANSFSGRINGIQKLLIVIHDALPSIIVNAAVVRLEALRLSSSFPYA